MVMHRLTTMKMADEILILDNGRVIESGTYQNLLQNKGVYWRMWQQQQRSLAIEQLGQIAL